MYIEIKEISNCNLKVSPVHTFNKVFFFATVLRRSENLQIIFVSEESYISQPTTNFSFSNCCTSCKFFKSSSFHLTLSF